MIPVTWQTADSGELTHENQRLPWKSTMPIFNHFGISNLYFSTENKKSVHFFYAHNCVVFMDGLIVVAKCNCSTKKSIRILKFLTNASNLNKPRVNILYIPLVYSNIYEKPSNSFYLNLIWKKNCQPSFTQSSNFISCYLYHT